jgi:ComF family protein
MQSRTCCYRPIWPKHRIWGSPRGGSTTSCKLVVLRGCVFSSSWLARSTLGELAPSSARKIPAALFSFLFPDQCRLCDEPLEEISRVPVCRACLAKPEALSAEYFCVQCRTPFLSRFPLDDQGRCALCRRGVRGFDAAYSFGFYENELRKLIHLFKYGRVRTLARPLGILLARALPREQSFDVIVPMPLHWRKRWQRGFNQSDLLAREIAWRTNTPVKNALRRVRNTASQAGLTSAKRRENVSGAFQAPGRAKKSAVLQGKRVLLIDDVMTTGATAASCARALKRAGARQVTLLTLARADRRLLFDPLIMSDSSQSDSHQSDSHQSDTHQDSNFSGRPEDAQSRSLA